MDRVSSVLCECNHAKTMHANGLGACIGMCRCSRFRRLTRQFSHLKMMEAALLSAIDVIDSLPCEGRTIKVGIPDRDEITLIIRQMKKALAGPPV
jgi:hypothetical protein